MRGWEPKEDLRRYLQVAREALLWKLDGLSEYDIRRPMVPTGTNLLGLVKHLAGVEVGYFGDSFGRPFHERLPWFEDGAEPNADMWATAEESREQIVALYRRASTHSDATIDKLALDAIGHVPWWPEDRSEVTLHTVLVHVIAETARHAGHADIVRELIDGSAGLREGNDNMAPGGPEWWESYRSRLEASAQEAGQKYGQYSPMPALMVLDEGALISISFDDLLKYHGRSSIAGVAHAFKAMERAFPILAAGQPPDRYGITVESGFGGAGARDAFEMVTRAVTGDRYRVSPELAGPEVPEAPGGHFFFRLVYEGTVVDLALRQGLVPQEFLQLACREAPDAAEAARAQQLKEEMAERLLALPAEEVYDAKVER
ncbi:MAG: DinB family protein [Actinobacteria bacterium]|nr:DinB family protein [Actinomycetota bacterium]